MFENRYMILDGQELSLVQAYYRRQMIKSGFIVSFILLFALISTYCIYYKFKGTRDQHNNLENLDITFHEKAGDQVTLTKIAPVSDSVGQSSHAYTFTIKNNLETPINYSIKLIKDLDAILEDDCEQRQIPISVIKGSIHKEKEENQLFMVSDLKDNTIVSRKLKGKESVSYTVRFWTTASTLPLESDLHFHGKLQVIENEVDIATTIQ